MSVVLYFLLVNKNYLFFLFLFVLGVSFGFLLGPRSYTKVEVKPPLVSSFLKTPLPIEDKRITLIAVGDILLARKVNYKMVMMNNFNWPFEKVVDFLKSSDFTFANLESPLVENCKPTETGMVFCGDKRGALGLVFAGIDACNLANNHSLNYGEDGLSQTKQILKNAGIASFGGADIFRKEIKGARFSFLGFNEVGLGEEAYKKLLSQVASQVESERKLADVVVVSFHWGNEYTENISSRQKELAHLAIDSGGDLVIGHHPHWVQGQEEYKGKRIFYSLGNFVFDQMWSEKTKEGLAIRLTFDGGNLLKVEEFLVKIEDFGQPTLID